jgi:hypothetical protein
MDHAVDGLWQGRDAKSQDSLRAVRGLDPQGDVRTVLTTTFDARRIPGSEFARG